MPVSSPRIDARGMRISGNNFLSMVSRFLICDRLGPGVVEFSVAEFSAGFFAGTNTSL
jgi:hypothetical protein